MRIIAAIILIASTSASSSAEDISSQKRFAKVIALTGKATVTRPDGTTAQLRLGDDLWAGTALKTDAGGTVDLFFRRIGTILQVQTNTALTLDKLESEMKRGKLVKRTELSLKQGSILGCIRVLIPESKVLIRTPKVLLHVSGTGMGRFEFWADGSVLVGQKSKLSVVTDTSGDLMPVTPGQFFSGKSAQIVQANPSLLDALSKKMDVLQATATQLTPPPLSEELP